MFQPAGFVQVSPKNRLFSYILHYTTLLGEVHLKAILNCRLGQNSAVITPLNKTSVMYLLRCLWRSVARDSTHGLKQYERLQK